jgi:hypothetical protein
VPATIHKLGPFAEPALVRVRQLTDDATVREEAEWLLGELRK